MRVRARAPLRLGLAGGGTDVSPYCDLHGGLVLNATIDKYAYSSIDPAEDTVTFVAADRQERVSMRADEFSDDGPMALHRGVYNRVVKEFNGGQPIPHTLTTYSDAPPGSGLGSSSTLVVSMVKAYTELLSLPLGEYDIARLAYEIERVDCGLAGGRQDQYAATFGGFNFMEFLPGERVIINPLRVKGWILSELEASLLLYFGGVSRESAAIIDEQVSNVRRGDLRAVAAMHSLKTEALAMKESLLKGDFDGLVESMQIGWDAKKRMARSITNPAIEEAYLLAESAGMRAGKISGAGGGGFMMMLVDPVRRMDVIRGLQQTSGEVMTCRFTKAGSESWRLP